MGKINNYQTETPNPGDKMLTSDYSTGATKNVTVQSVVDLGRSSKVYRAFLNQTGVTPPVATVVPGNTITGAWTYNDVGEYIFTSNGTFSGVKTACVTGLSVDENDSYAFAVSTGNTIILSTFTSGAPANDALVNLYIEITTYEV